jgi:hypothetical protein
MLHRLVAAVVGLALASSSAAAQSLAEVARAEEARRKAVRGEAKVYTNDTLGVAPAESPKPEPADAAPAAKPGSAGETAKPTAKPGAVQETPKDEKHWRDRITAARAAVQRSETAAEALESQINALYTEFLNLNDPVQRTIVEQKRLAAIAEQDRVKADIARNTKAVAEIEDEARRANVPAGWLR